MNFTGVESSLSESGKLLESTVARREKLIKESREVIALSAKSIICIHNSQFEEAKQLQKLAIDNLRKLRELAGSDLVRYIISPETGARGMFGCPGYLYQFCPSIEKETQGGIRIVYLGTAGLHRRDEEDGLRYNSEIAVWAG